MMVGTTDLGASDSYYMDTKMAATEAITLERLPDEILVFVFSWLPSWSLACTVPRVCRRWLDLSEDRSLWERARLDCGGGGVADDGCTQEAALQTLASAPRLHTLTFGGPYSPASSELLRAVVMATAPVTALHILAMEYDADLLLRAVHRLSPHLEELTLRVDKKLASRGAPADLLLVLAGMPRLASLRLLGNIPRGSAEGWARLERLDLRQAVLDRDDADAFLVAVLRCCAQRLTTLLMPRYTPLAPVVFSQLSQCRRVTQFAPSRLEDLVIADALPILTDLLVECDLFDHKKHEFVRRLSGLRRVRGLSLRVGDEEGAVFLARACPATHTLTLRGTLSKWVVEIVTALPELRRIRVIEPAVRLRLGTADPMTTRGGFLAQAVDGLPKLAVLDLADCFQRRRPSHHFLDELYRAHPGLTIILPPLQGPPQCKDLD